MARPGLIDPLLRRAVAKPLDADLAGVVTADLRVVAVVKSGAPDRVDVPPIVLPTVITPVGPVTTNSSSTSEPVTTSTEGDALEAGIDGPASVISGTTVTYSSTSTGSPDGFEWTVNRSVVGTDSSMRTSFATPGSYTVGLTVTKAGASASTSVRVEARAGGVELPDVRGKTEKEARSVLEPTFVVSTRTVEVASADKVGRVVDQNPQPGRAPSARWPTGTRSTSSCRATTTRPSAPTRSATTSARWRRPTAPCSTPRRGPPT